jgi:NAD(P)H-hydrate repair Nnr-like enzyme with NAD(P)H-hydrate dehydratase domain
VGAYQADPNNKSNAGKSYIVFGKQNNTDAINLSAIAAGTSTDGFVINHLNRRRLHHLRWRLSSHSHHPLTRH